MKAVDFEFLFVNDGSKDNSLNIVKKYKEKDLSLHMGSCNLCDYELYYRGKR